MYKKVLLLIRQILILLTHVQHLSTSLLLQSYHLKTKTIFALWYRIQFLQNHHISFPGLQWPNKPERILLWSSLRDQIDVNEWLWQTLLRATQGTVNTSIRATLFQVIRCWTLAQFHQGFWRRICPHSSPSHQRLPLCTLVNPSNDCFHSTPCKWWCKGYISSYAQSSHNAIAVKWWSEH